MTCVHCKICMKHLLLYSYTFYPVHDFRGLEPIPACTELCIEYTVNRLRLYQRDNTYSKTKTFSQQMNQDSQHTHRKKKIIKTCTLFIQYFRQMPWC